MVGTVCAEVIDRSTTSQLLKLTFRTKPNFAFTGNEMWIGSDTTRLPRTELGGPAWWNFPYMAYNATGTDVWEAFVTLKCNKYPASMYTLTAVAQSTIIVTADNSSTFKAYSVENDSSRGVEFSWMEFLVDCHCEKKAPTSTDFPTNAPSSTDTNSSTLACAANQNRLQGLCRKLFTQAGEAVGSACVKQPDGSNFTEVMFSTNRFWSFISHEVWAGDDPATLMESDGSHSWSNGTGAREWSATVGVTCTGQDQGKRKVYVASRSIARQITKSGELLENTEESVFQLNRTDGSRVPTWDWLYFEVECGGHEVEQSTLANNVCGEDQYAIEFKASGCGVQTIELASACGQESPGELELSTVGDGNNKSMDVMFTFRPSGERSFQNTELWFDRSLVGLPVNVNDGTLDLASFPYFASDSNGAAQSIFRESISLDCSSGNDESTFVGVAHATVTQTGSGNKTESSFAYMHDGPSSAIWYGYFDFTILCRPDCPTAYDSESPALKIVVSS